jgi:hypothetical protein
MGGAGGQPGGEPCDDQYLSGPELNGKTEGAGETRRRLSRDDETKRRGAVVS